MIILFDFIIHVFLQKMLAEKKSNDRASIYKEYFDKASHMHQALEKRIGDILWKKKMIHHNLVNVSIQLSPYNGLEFKNVPVYQTK